MDWNNPHRHFLTGRPTWMPRRQQASHAVGCVLIAVAVAVMWNFYGDMFMSALPSPEALAPIPQVPYGPPAPPSEPLRDYLALAAAVSAAALTCLICHIDFTALVPRAGRGGSPETSGAGPMWKARIAAAAMPMIAQPAMRVSVLVGGSLGIMLWFFGTDSFAMVDSLLWTAGVGIGSVALAMMLFFTGSVATTLRRAWPVAEAFMVVWVANDVAAAAIGVVI